jgi:hypothetical protein
MCASKEIDMRESARDCTLASGEGLSSGGETSHPMSLYKAVSSSREHTVFYSKYISHLWTKQWLGISICVPTVITYMNLHSYLETEAQWDGEGHNKQ